MSCNSKPALFCFFTLKYGQVSEAQLSLHSQTSPVHFRPLPLFS